MCKIYIAKNRIVYGVNNLNIVFLQNWAFALSTVFLQRGKPPPKECPRYDTKQSDGEDPVMLEHWRMRRTPSLTSLPGPLCPGVVAPDRVLFMGQIDLNCELMLNWIVRNSTVLYANMNSLNIETVLTLNWIVWNRIDLTESKQKYTYTKLNWLNQNCLTKLNSLK